MQQLLCCLFFCVFRFFFYCIILRRNCPIDSIQISDNGLQQMQGMVCHIPLHSNLQRLILFITPALIEYVCHLPLPPVHPPPNGMYTNIDPFHSFSASLCFHNSSVLYPVDLCRSPFLFLVVNTFPSMLNNVCLCVQVSLCILS